MKILIQILTLSLFILFSLSGNAQTRPNVKYAKPKYNKKNIYKPSSKKKVMKYKPKQKKKKEEKYAMVVEKGGIAMKKVSSICRKYTKKDCDDIPSYCQEYFAQCDDNDDDSDDNSDDDLPPLSDILQRMPTSVGDDGELPDVCQVLIDDCHPNPTLRNFQNLLSNPNEPYVISIKDYKGRTVAYTNTKYSKTIFKKGYKYSKLKIKNPKFSGKALVKITNLKTKRSKTFKTIFR